MRRVKRPKRTSVVSCILPHLKNSCDFLCANQLADGSWSKDIIISALVLRALVTFSNSTKEKALKREIKTGISFLRNAVNSLADRILQTEDLYSGLDRTAIEFGNAISTLWFANSLNYSFHQKIISAFSKVENTVAKYIKALNNVEVACSILNCHAISSTVSPSIPLFEFTSASEQILIFALNQFFSKDLPPKDAFLLVITFQNFKTTYSSKLEEGWKRQVSRRTDAWKNLFLEEGLQKLVIDKSSEIVKAKAVDPTTLSYGIISFNCLNLDALDLQEKLLSNGINIWKCSSPLSELGFLVWALSESNFAKVSFFPFKDRKNVISAINWFDKMNAKKIKMLESSQYSLLIVFVIILISLVTIMSYLAFSDFWKALTILSILLGASFFIINWLSKKPIKD